MRGGQALLSTASSASRDGGLCHRSGRPDCGTQWEAGGRRSTYSRGQQIVRSGHESQILSDQRRRPRASESMRRPVELAVARSGDHVCSWRTSTNLLVVQQVTSAAGSRVGCCGKPPVPGERRKTGNDQWLSCAWLGATATGTKVAVRGVRLLAEHDCVKGTS